MEPVTESVTAESSLPGRLPVSIKGVVLDPDDRVLLLRNDRGEWELPGGRMELGETPEQTVVREIAEEVGWTVAAGPVLDTWLYQPLPGAYVFIATYGCRLLDGGTPQLSHEHTGAGLFGADDLDGLPLPEGYRRSVRAWLGRATRPR